MARKLIDADALSMAMYHEAMEKDSDMQRWDSGCWIRYKLFERVFDAQPTVDAEPVRHGKWMEMIEVNELGEPYQSGVYCSECGHTDCYEPNYVDDGGACYESWIYYHIDCPYFCGDERTHCDKDHDPSFERCVRCKMEWLDFEVDE